MRGTYLIGEIVPAREEEEAEPERGVAFFSDDVVLDSRLSVLLECLVGRPLERS